MVRCRDAAPDQPARVGDASQRHTWAGGFDHQAAFATINQDIYELCVELLGAAALVDYDYEFRRDDHLGYVGPPGSARQFFLRTRANSIEGGTTEIQRNIVGERVLGLPKEPGDLSRSPFNEIPKNGTSTNRDPAR